MPQFTRFSLYHSELWEPIPILQCTKCERGIPHNNPVGSRRGPPVEGFYFVDVANEKLNQQRNELENSPQQGC